MFASHLTKLVAASSLAFGVVQFGQPALAFSPADITPFIQSRGPGVSGAINSGGTVDGSYGYFFEVAGAHRFVNALGFSAQDNWIDNTNLTYTVQLWSWLTDPLDPNPNTATTYTSLASLTFNPNDSDLLLAGSDFWKPLAARLSLPDTASNPNAGYVITAYGNFSNNADPAFRGNFIESGSDVTFSSLATYGGNGYNLQTFPDYPVPVYDGGQVGYWNANFSVGVPGPLPLLGAGSALLWSRRLKRKVNSKM